MFALCHYFEIIRTIIQFVSVDVMDNFVVSKRASKFIFHHKPILSLVFPIYPDMSISELVYCPSTLPVSNCISASNGTKSTPSLFDVALVCKKFFSAHFAISSNVGFFWHGVTKTESRSNRDAARLKRPTDRLGIGAASLIKVIIP